MIKINRVDDYKKLFFQNEQLGSEPIILPDHLTFTKSYDAVIRNTRIVVYSYTTVGAQTQQITIPNNQQWAVKAIAMISDSALTDITISTLVVNSLTGSLSAFPWHYTAALAASVPSTYTSMGSGDLILHPGNVLRFAFTQAGAGTTNLYVIYSLMPEGTEAT